MKSKRRAERRPRRSGAERSAGKGREETIERGASVLFDMAGIHWFCLVLLKEEGEFREGGSDKFRLECHKSLSIRITQFHIRTASKQQLQQFTSQFRRTVAACICCPFYIRIQLHSHPFGKRGHEFLSHLIFLFLLLLPFHLQFHLSPHFHHPMQHFLSLIHRTTTVIPTTHRIPMKTQIFKTHRKRRRRRQRKRIRRIQFIAIRSRNRSRSCSCTFLAAFGASLVFGRFLDRSGCFLFHFSVLLRLNERDIRHFLLLQFLFCVLNPLQ